MLGAQGSEIEILELINNNSYVQRCSLADCRMACDVVSNCVGVSYADPPPQDPTQKQCYLKNNVCNNPVPGTHIFYMKQPFPL